MTSPQRRDRRFFASDNAAGVHPTLLEAIHRANTGHALAYGHDEWTAAATARIREMFKTDAEVLFVFGGTGALPPNGSWVAKSCRSLPPTESSDPMTSAPTSRRRKTFITRNRVRSPSASPPSGAPSISPTSCERSPLSLTVTECGSTLTELGLPTPLLHWTSLWALSAPSSG